VSDLWLTASFSQHEISGGEIRAMPVADTVALQYTLLAAFADARN
jgi:hypothetical protein